MPRKKPPKTVADLMRSWREVAGLSVTEAGGRLDLSARTIEGIEGGRRADDEVLRIALESLIEKA